MIEIHDRGMETPNVGEGIIYLGVDKVKDNIFYLQKWEKFPK